MKEFEVAFSFNEMMRFTAFDLRRVAESLGYRCYFYTAELVRQSGLNIDDLARAIYENTDSVIIESTRYGKTYATYVELAAIRKRLSCDPDARTIVVRHRHLQSPSDELLGLINKRAEQVKIVEIDNRLTRSRDLFGKALLEAKI